MTRTPSPSTASALDAVAHFQAKLRWETDVSDVAAALNHSPGGTSPAPTRSDGATARERSGSAPHANLGAAVVVVDTRSRAAWDAGHIPGAVHLPAADIPRRADEVAAGASVVVTYCWGPGCNGATRGALAFALAGYSVREMIGGFEYWAREGFPVESAHGLSAPAPDPLTVVVCGC